MVRPDGRQVTAPEVPNVNEDVVVVTVVVQLVIETVDETRNNPLMLPKNDLFFLSSQSTSSSASCDESTLGLVTPNSFLIRPVVPKSPSDGSADDSNGFT